MADNEITGSVQGMTVDLSDIIEQVAINDRDFSATFEDGKTIPLVITDDTVAENTQVVIEFAEGAVQVNGKNITSGAPVHVNLVKNPRITIKVSEGNDSNTFYIQRVNYANDVKVNTVKNIGWFGAKHYEGDLDGYTAGGILIPTKGFKAKYVVSLQVTDGFIGSFDLETSMLKVYKSGNAEASASDLTTVRYSMILMQ